MSGVVSFGQACTPTSIARLRPFPSRGEVTLDLSRTRFISPGGVVGLCLLGRGVCDHGQPLTIKLGTQIASYACRMGLHEYFGHIPDVEFDPPIDLWDVQHHDRRGDLVELTLVAVDDDDQVNDASAAVSEVLAEQLPDLAGREREAIINGVAELLSNVERHSGETEALFTVQSYRWEVVLSVGDAGRGVRASLNHLHGSRIRRMTDGQVL